MSKQQDCVVCTVHCFICLVPLSTCLYSPAEKLCLSLFGITLCVIAPSQFFCSLDYLLLKYLRTITTNTLVSFLCFWAWDTSVSSALGIFLKGPWIFFKFHLQYNNKVKSLSANLLLCKYSESFIDKIKWLQLSPLHRLEFPWTTLWPW